MESSQETPSFMPPVGSRTLPLWTELLQTDDSLMMDILRTGFEHGFSSFEEAWEQLQQLSPSLLHSTFAKHDSFLMGVPFEYFLPTQRSSQLLTYVVQRGFRPGVYNYNLAERLIHTNGWATSQEGFDGAFFITPFIIYTDEAVGGWQLSQLAPSPAFTHAARRHQTPASSTSSSSSIASSSLESSQVSDALARERAELSQLMFTATQTSAELILNKASTSPEPEAEILSKFNPGNHSWRVYLRIGVLSGNTRLATLQALLKAKQVAVSAAAASLAQQSPASLGLPSSSQESPTPSGRSNSSGHSPFSSSSSSSSGAAGVMGGGASSNLFTPPSTPLRTTAIVATTTSPSSPPSVSSSLSAASSPQQQRVAAKISDNDLNAVYRSASDVIRRYQLAGNNGVWLSPLMPIYGRYYNIIHLLALPVHQIVSMVEDPNTKVKPREWSFADTLLKLSNAVQLSKTEAMNQIQNNRVLKVALAAAEHIFDDAKSKKSLPLWEMLPYFVLTKQDLPVW